MGNLETRTAELRTRWVCDEKEFYHHEFCLKHLPYYNSRIKSNFKIFKAFLKYWCCKTRLVISLYGLGKGRKEPTVPFSLSTTEIKQEFRKIFSGIVITFFFPEIPLGPRTLPIDRSKGYIHSFCRYHRQPLKHCCPDCKSSNPRASGNQIGLQVQALSSLQLLGEAASALWTLKSTKTILLSFHWIWCSTHSIKILTRGSAALGSQPSL